MTSLVHLRYHFLQELASTDVRNRKTMIRYINAGQMEAIAVIANYIKDARIPILERDDEYFRRKRRILRVLASETIPLQRKKRVLLRYHTLVPRILRPMYLDFTRGVERRSTEE